MGREDRCGRMFFGYSREPMDAGQRDELSRWAGALAQSGNPQSAAAGRAILALCEANATGSAIDRRELMRTAKALGGAKTAELRSAGRAIRGLCAENAALGGGAAERRPATPPTAALPWRRLAIGAGALLVLGGGALVAARAAGPDLGASGPAPDALVGREELAALSFSAQLADARWMLDGRPVRPVAVRGRFRYRPSKLSDGEHTLVVSRPARVFGSARKVFTFRVDTTPPMLRLGAPAVVRPGTPLVVRGTLEPGARLERSGASVPVDAEGAFVLRVRSAPRSFVLLATDRAGNSSRWRVPVTVAPRRPKEPVRSVHVTAYGWADDELREGVLALVRAGKINAIELDLKDEAGEIGFNPPIARARRNKAALPIYDLGKTVRELHAQGVRVIGRLVCFRDPIAAADSWQAGRRAEVIQTPSGEPYAGYGGFTNFAHPAVRKYNIDVAVAAAKLGVDEILYDYVRRPDGPSAAMVYPGLRGTPERAIVRFLAESRAALAGTDALVGVSVFGVAATRPTEVAQDIPGMAREVDYVAPMVYPSHWGPGEYEVSDPNGDPYTIVRRSTEDFVEKVRGTGARVVPWLQDFSLGRTYGPNEVRAQIKGARDAGADEFILWDAAVTYTAEGLEPTAARPALGLATAAPKGAPGPIRLPLQQPGETSVAPSGSGRPAGTQPRSSLPLNELGRIPVVMHHMIRADRVGEYDQTPQEFRAELEYLWRQGYAPVSAGDLVAGKLDVPRGTSPVVLTFDDATTYQFQLTAGGKVEPSTAVGIMLDFARTHPGFVPAGTFYVNRTPFGSAMAAKEALRWLTSHGFEIGNHTRDHIPLHTLSDDAVRMQIATGAELIQRILPGYRIRTLALPLGSLPGKANLAVKGGWEGRSYGPYGVMLVGAGPAPSPYSKDFDPAGIPRIRTSHAGWRDEADFAFGYWMRELKRHPHTRYIADGEPDKVTIPTGTMGDVAARFAGRAQPRA